jgi:hypothetical protein
MGIFNKRKEPIKPIDKAAIILEIVDICPAEWQIIEGKDACYDLLIIRTVTKEVNITINAMNPHTKTENMDLQQVFAVTVANTGNEEDYAETRGWTTGHFITSKPEKLLRRIKEFD